MRMLLLILALAVLPFKALAEGRQVVLYAPPDLIATGVMDYILPRFKLKTQVPVVLTGDLAAAEVVIDAGALPLFEGAGQAWSLRVVQDTAWTARFADWLQGEIGLNTVLSYAPEGDPVFRAVTQAAQVAPPVVLSGDPALGLEVSRAKCARCHVVDAQGFTGIGSTPSFAILRGFADWQDRFIGFFALNPHPAFTQIDGVTEAFDPTRPSPIVPLEMTLDEVDAVAAYVAGMAPADLGAPLQSQ